MNLAEILKKENIFIAKSFKDTNDFYVEYCKFLQARGIISDDKIARHLFIKRESLHSTGISKGAAAPHIFSEEFPGFIFSIALIQEGLDFKAPDEKDVYVVFLLMSPERDVGLHLKSLAHIARLVNSTDIIEAIKKAGSPAEICKILAEKEKLI